MATRSKAKIEFRSQQLVARRRSPDSERVSEAISEVRWDPLTGRTMRIAAPRPFKRDFDQNEGRNSAGRHSDGTRWANEIPEEALGQKRCPFCKDLATVAPGLVSEMGGERQLNRGEATLFPNLYPYGRHSAVIALTKAHHVPLRSFSQRQLADGLLLARSFIQRVLSIDPESRYINITWNLLPSSGGTLVHPHFQVNADPIPVNSLRDLQAASLRFTERTGEDYWRALVDVERQHGARFLADVGETSWLMPFAPRAHLEVWGLLPGRTSIARLADGEVQDFADGLWRTLQGYGHLRRNALNFGMESDEGDTGGPALRLRVVVRSNYRAWYRSDQTHFNVALDELATILAPEAAAALLRPAFDAPAGLDETARA